jgi:hypothetical protein
MMFNRLTLAAGAIVGGLAVFLVMMAANVLWVIPEAKRDGLAAYVAEQAAADRKAELERKGDDAKLKGMSDFELCVDGLRSRRLPVSACEQLRGLPPG